MAKVQDEAGHGLYLYSAAETLGARRDELLDMLHAGQAAVLLDLQLPDADLGRHGRDRLARRRRRDHQPGADLPLLLRPVRAGDGAHLQGGVLPPAPGLRDPATRSRTARPSSTRWPRTRSTAGGGRRLMMFGPPDDESPNSRPVDGLEDQAVLQRRAAPEVRRHVRAPGRGARPDAARPGPAAGTRRRGHYDFGEIDWTEFFEVLKGNGPCNAAADRAPPPGTRRGRVGARGGDGVRRKTSGATERA